MRYTAVLDYAIDNAQLRLARAKFPQIETYWCGGSTSGEGPMREGRGTSWAGPPRYGAILDTIHAIKNVADPENHYELDLSYAGAFQMLKGRALSPHRDKTYAKQGLIRRLTCLLYLDDCDGGELEIWDDEKISEVVEIKQNRLVIMPADAWHAVRRVRSPRRMSIACHLAEKSDEKPTMSMTWWVDKIS